VQLAGVFLLVVTGSLALFAGDAKAQPAAGTEVPGSALPIGTVTTGTPFSSGQVIQVQVPANPVLTPGAGIIVVECAAPGGAVPTQPSDCDGNTIQGDTIFAGADGSVSYTNVAPDHGYTVYSLPNSALGESSGGTPACNLADECVLYIGQNQNDFTQPHFFSQPFWVTPNSGNTGASPGDGSAPPAPTGVDPSTSTITEGAVPPSPVADGTDPATITVRLMDSDSVPVPGKTVTLSAAGGSSVISPATATSAADGTAVFTVTDATPETVTYSAQDTTDSVTLTSTVKVTFAAPVVTVANSTVIASPTQVASDGTTASTVTVTLKDQAAGGGNPVPGKVVTLAGSSGTNSTVTILSGTTNSAGQATFSVVDSTPEVVTYTATDTTDNDLVLTSTVSVTFGTLVPSATGSTVVAAAPIVEVASSAANATANTNVTVTLLSSGGSPVAGKSVSLASSSTTVTISPAAAIVTNGQGEAVFTVSDSASETAVFTAMDVTDGVTLTATATVEFQTAAPSPAASTITAQLSTLPADGETESAITVTINDQFGNPLPGKTVTVQLTDTSGDAAAPPLSGGGSTPGVTNSKGSVVFELVDTTAEMVTVGATDTTDGFALTSTVIVTFTAGAADASASTLSANPTSVPADGTTASTITVTVRDHEQNPVAGAAITLTPSGGSSKVTVVSGTTDSAGVATFSVTDTTAEVVTYTATDTTDGLTIGGVVGVSVTFGSPPGPPPTVAGSVMSASAASAPADGSTAVTITVVLSDANGAPVTGKTVALDAQSGHSVVTPQTGVTDQNGQVAFSVTDTTAESVTYTATDTTDNLPLTGLSATVAFTTPAPGSTTTTTTTTTVPAGSTTTTTAAGSTTTTTAAPAATQSTDGGAAPVSASASQLAFTGTPPLLPWLLGLGFLFLVGGSLGRRYLRIGT
jgi:hypothetical protein